MAFKLFVDTNVYLDHLMQRGEWESAYTLFMLAEQQQLHIYTSSSSLINVMYVMNAYKLSRQDVISNTLSVLSFTTLVNPDNVAFEIALRSSFKDMEDAVQYYTALEITDVNYFITSNIKDFKSSLPRLPVLTPGGFLKKYYKQ